MNNTIRSAHSTVRQFKGWLLVSVLVVFGAAGVQAFGLAQSAAAPSAGAGALGARRFASSQSLYALNERLYPSSTGAVPAGSQAALRLRNLNEQLYPADPADAAQSSRATKLLRRNEAFYPSGEVAPTAPSTYQRHLWRIEQDLDVPPPIPPIRAGKPQ